MDRTGQQMQGKPFAMMILSFVIFGFMPIYWSLLKEVESFTILYHRCLWIFVTLLPLMWFKSDFRRLLSTVRRQWGFLVLSACAITTNWLGYIYAVTHGHIFEASLAYYISPLLTVLMGFTFLKETINPRQWAAVVLALSAILYLIIRGGTFPTYAVVIAFSFALYGLLSRVLELSSIERMAVESFAITLVFTLFFHHPMATYLQFVDFDQGTRWLLVFAGAATILPFSLYIGAIKRFGFATIGMLSFILPSMIFLLGIFYFHEPLDNARLLSMVLIWMAIGIYVFDLFFPRAVLRVAKG